MCKFYAYVAVAVHDFELFKLSIRYYLSVKDGPTDKKLSEIAKAYDSSYSTSKFFYEHIKDNIDKWIEETIKIRKEN